MADDVILVTETGQTNLQAYTNTVSGKSVKAEALVQVDLTGVPVPRGTVADPRFVKITDGTNTPTIKNAVPGGTDYALSVRQVGNNTIGGTVQVNIASIAANLPATNLLPTIAYALDGASNVQPAATNVTGFGESLVVVPIGSQSQVLQQETSTNELQIVQHVGSTGIDPRQIRALAGTDKPDITANQSGSLKTILTDPVVSTQQANIDAQGRLQVVSNPPSLGWGGNWTPSQNLISPQYNGRW